MDLVPFFKYYGYWMKNLKNFWGISHIFWYNLIILLREYSMDWDYTLFDAVQLMIPILCTFLTILVALIYLFMYRNFLQKIYSAGFLFTLIAMFYALFESLVIIYGWTGQYVRGRAMHFTGQIVASYFLYAMMLFATALPVKGSLVARISRVLSYIGLGAAILLTLISLVKPDLFISLSEPASYGYVTPGDFARGKEGVLLSVRDMFFGIFITLLIIISIYSLFQNREDRRIIFFVIGTIIAAVSAVDDLFFFHFNHNFYLNKFRYSRLSVGLSLMALCILIGILKDYFQTQNRLKSTHEILQNTYYRLKMSEQKYRKLAEGADHAVFSLSRDFHFISYNKKTRIYFNLAGERENLSLPDLLGSSRGNRNKGAAGQILLENLSQLSREKESVSFHSVIDDPRTGEPEELGFHIDYFETDDGDVEYICRAEKMKANRLIRCIEQEKLQLSIDNYIIAIDDVTTRLTSALNKFMDTGSSLMIKMGLQEIIINAIEHGNLNITFEEKSEAMRENRYLEFIRERQMDNRYKNRMVRIDYFLNKDSVQYMVTDEGEGFDYRGTMRKVDDSVEKNHLSHGRGINMTRVLFDRVEYNSKGNQVLLVKKLENPTQG